MNTQQEPAKPVIENPWTETRMPDELTRVKIFLGIQTFFLVVSVFTGGFNFKLWSMLDTALMIQSIGVTALVWSSKKRSTGDLLSKWPSFYTCWRCLIWE